jgi:hypothetical protein
VGHDRCVVCVERTIGSEIVLNTPDGTPEWVMWSLVSVRMVTVLVSVQYRCTICAEHTLGSEIVLDTPDDTPR